MAKLRFTHWSYVVVVLIVVGQAFGPRPVTAAAGSAVGPRVLDPRETGV